MTENNSNGNGRVSWRQLQALFPVVTYLLAAGAGFVTFSYGLHDKMMLDVEKRLNERLAQYVKLTELLTMRQQDLEKQVQWQQGLLDRIKRLETLLERR